MHMQGALGQRHAMSPPLLPLLLAVATALAAVTAALVERGSVCDGGSKCIRASDCRRSLMQQHQHPSSISHEREPSLVSCGFEGLNLLVCCSPHREDHEVHASSSSGRPGVAAALGTTQAPYLQPGTTRTTQPPYRPTQKTVQPSYVIPTLRTTESSNVPFTQSSYYNSGNQRTTQSTYIESKPITQAPYLSNVHTERPYQGVQKQTQTPYIDTKTTQRTTQKPYNVNRPPERSTQPPYLSPQRTTQISYVDKRPVTPIPTVDARPTHTTPKFHHHQQTQSTVDSRPTHTTPKINRFESTQATAEDSRYNSRPIDPAPHYITHGAPERTTRNPYDTRPQVHEDVLTATNSRPPLDNQPKRPYEENYPSEEFSNSRAKRPASPRPQDIVFELQVGGSPHLSRPATLRPTQFQNQRPVSTSTTTESQYTPSRRPYESPYITQGPVGPPLPDKPLYTTHTPNSQGFDETGVQRPQSTRPTSLPPNLSSTHPGSNTVGSGEGGHVDPQVAVRPATSLQHHQPARDEEDLTKHHNFRLLPPDICGTNVVGEDRITNGHNATLGQLPWMALLGYKSSEAAEDFVSVCGGTLISWKYVLTAAHCLKKSVRLVRLGEHVVSTEPDCDQDGLCADPVADIEIETKIPHPSYGKPYLKNDIGLIRMRQAQPRLFSSYVRPICLPLVQDKQRPGRKLFVAGWGLTRRGSKISSDVLQMAVLPEVGLAECNDAQEDDILKPVVASQMCAAVTDHGASTCYGDSGGPLMDIQQGRGRRTNEPVFVQLGIVSVGSDDCGLHGAPSIFTRVSSYTQWVLDTLRD